MSGAGMASVGQVAAKVGHAVEGQAQQHGMERTGHYFLAPLQKPRVAGAADGGEVMPEWKLNCLCSEYGLPLYVRAYLPMGGRF